MIAKKYFVVAGAALVIVAGMSWWFSARVSGIEEHGQSRDAVEHDVGDPGVLEVHPADLSRLENAIEAFSSMRRRSRPDLAPIDPGPTPAGWLAFPDEVAGWLAALDVPVGVPYLGAYFGELTGEEVAADFPGLRGATVYGGTTGVRGTVSPDGLDVVQLLRTASTAVMLMPYVPDEAAIRRAAQQVEAVLELARSGSGASGVWSDLPDEADEVARLIRGLSEADRIQSVSFGTGRHKSDQMFRLAGLSLAQAFSEGALLGDPGMAGVPVAPIGALDVIPSISFSISATTDAGEAVKLSAIMLYTAEYHDWVLAHVQLMKQLSPSASMEDFENREVLWRIDPPELVPGWMLLSTGWTPIPQP